DGYGDVLVGASGFDGGQVDEGRALLYLGSPSGLAAEPSWAFESDQPGAQLGAALAPAGDVNGDGVCDVLVAASQYDAVLTDEGRAWLYLGGPAGLATNPAWTAEGEPNALFGSALAPAGDVDGDGFADVIVGAKGYSNPSLGEGLAFLYRGSASGLENTPAWSAESDLFNANLGASVAPAGDVNGDGYDDVLVGAPQLANPHFGEGSAFLFLGSPAGLSSTPDWSAEGEQLQSRFGQSVAAAGDVNGDGYGDFLVGANRFDAGETDEGRAFLYLGARGGLSTEPSWVQEGQAFGQFFGTSVASARDVNGDGFGDVLVGAPGHRNGQNEEGRAVLYLGSAAGLASTPAWTREGNRERARFGGALCSAGDANGDGYDDVLIAAPSYTNGESEEGRVVLYQGSPTGLATAVAWSAEGNLVLAQFGTVVSSAGDVNGDGFGDVLIAARRHGGVVPDAGRVVLYLGSRSGLRSTPAWETLGEESLAGHGFALASAGDVNGDGYGDFLVSARSQDGVQIDQGRVSLYLGSVHGPSTMPAWVVLGAQGFDYLGSSLVGADVNGDGYGDVLVSDAERVLAYLGSPAGLGSTPAWTVAGGGSLGATDADGDGFDDVLVGLESFTSGEGSEGRALLYLGSPSGPATIPAWSIEGNQIGARLGRSIAGAGDVDGDGTGDAIVGAMQYSNGDSDEGAAFVHLGNEGRGGRVRGVQQVQVLGGAPVALLGSAQALTGITLRATLSSRPLGFEWASPLPAVARLEWELEPSLGGSFDGADTCAGPARPAAGVPLLLEEPLGVLPSGVPLRWRVRVRMGNPMLPATPWLSLPGNGRSETKLRTRAFRAQSAASPEDLTTPSDSGGPRAP
ncbi:MAG TPA: FG-GAP-like repeat-containing protein, partial [Planctomycetota bacterium]